MNAAVASEASAAGDDGPPLVPGASRGSSVSSQVLRFLRHECKEMTVAGLSWSPQAQARLRWEALDPGKMAEVPKNCRSWLRLVLGLDHTHNLNVHVRVHCIQDLLIIALGGLFGYVLFKAVYATGMDKDDQKDVIYFACYPGVLFIRLIRMVVQPLMFTAIATGVAVMVSAQISKSTLRSALAVIVGTTMAAICLAFVLGMMIRPGEVAPSGYLLRKAYDLDANATLDAVRDEAEAVQSDGDGKESALRHVMFVLDTLVPNNIVAAIAENNMLGLSCFSVLFGLAATSLDNDQVLRLLENLNQVIVAMIPYRTQPFAVFFLVAKVVATNAKDFGNIVSALGRFVGTVVLGLALHAAVLLAVYYAVTRRSPYRWLKDMEAALFVAFCTSSSAAALPYTMHAVGVNWPKTSTARFVLPLATQLNMNGTALFQTVLVIYIAQVTGYPLTFARGLLVAFFVLVASMTTAAIPGGSLVSIIYVLQVCAPSGPGVEDRWIESIALVLPVDKFLDMLRTTVNVLGDTVACAVVDHYRKLQTGKSRVLEGFDLEVIQKSTSHLHGSEAGGEDSHPADKDAKDAGGGPGQQTSAREEGEADRAQTSTCCNL